MFDRFAIVVLFVILTGCSSSGVAFMNTALERGAALQDQGIINAENYICRIASHGAVQRRYGRTEELVKAHRVICSRDAQFETMSGVNTLWL